MSPTTRARYRIAPANKIKDVRAYLKNYRPEHLRYTVDHLGVQLEMDAEDLPDVHVLSPARRPYISIGFDRSITLLTMEKIQDMRMLVNSWTQTCVRRQPLDVNLSNHTQFLTFSQERRALIGQAEDDISSIETWIDELKKRAIEILSYSFPDGLNWWFVPQNTKTAEYRRDCNVFRYSLFRRFLDPQVNQMGEASRDQRNMLFAYQAPCILSKRDLEDFVTMGAYPTWDLINSRSRSDFINSNTLRQWTKMWEVCRANDAHYFVLSSYKNSVFGCFSHGFTAAYVSDVISIADHSPTVLGYLSFWMASAASFQGSYKSPPKIEEPVNVPTHVRESFINHLLPPPLFLDPVWAGDGREPGLSAMADDAVASNNVMDDVMMDAVEATPDDDAPSLDGEEYDSRDQVDVDMLRIWFQGTKSHRPLNEDDFFLAYDDQYRERPEGRYKKGGYHGDWLLAF